MSKGISCAAIIGGGTMGGDIALIFAARGWETHVVEPSPQTRETLPSRLRAELQRLGAEEEEHPFYSPMASLLLSILHFIGSLNDSL